ncbi:hypothetical protein Cni_G02604 [Canna indica]|uniref:Cytochrome P450 n=1 Tax=Canna indica TaxID=4628 RepID=A0AAQ3JPN8_9LILI|nr:hypothetical protein Cni_G02604 [Canna indica]
MRGGKGGSIRWAIDLQHVLLCLTFDNVGMIAFGTDPGCLRPGLSEIPFARAFEDATAATIIRFIMPTAIWRALRYLDLGHKRCLRRCIERVDQFAYDVIRERKEDLSLSDGENEQMSRKTERSDLLTVFTQLKDEDGEPYFDKFLRDICVNFVLVGRDTSLVALWFFWLLNRHPKVEERILSEIRKIVEERVGDGIGDGEVVLKPEKKKGAQGFSPKLSTDVYTSAPFASVGVRRVDVDSGGDRKRGHTVEGGGEYLTEEKGRRGDCGGSESTAGGNRRRG